MALRRPLRFASSAVVVVATAAVGLAGCRKRNNEPPPDVFVGVAPPIPAAAAPPGALPPAGPPTAAPASCESITTCDACSATPGCDFCTEPRSCVREGSACRGLTLSHPSTCTNDPAVGGSQRARALAAMHAAVVAELRDMTPGPRIDARLERLTSLSFPVPAQHCFSLVWVIGDEATLREATVQLDFIGPRGSTGANITPLAPVGWSGRSCTSVPGQLVASIVSGRDHDRPTVGGNGPIAFVLHARPRTPADSDEGGSLPPPAR